MCGHFDKPLLTISEAREYISLRYSKEWSPVWVRHLAANGDFRRFKTGEGRNHRVSIYRDSIDEHFRRLGHEAAPPS